MESITKSPELMVALQGISKSKALSQIPEEEEQASKEISKPLSQSQNVVLSGESSSTQKVLSQSTFSKKTSEWYDKTHFQNVLTMEDGFYHTNPFQAISKFFPKGWFFKPWDLTKP